MRLPVAYIRKSVVHTGARTLSWEVQETEVRALAVRHGDTELTILSDWGKSGRKGAESRPGYAELLEDIATDRISVVYAYSLSRLSRSLVDYSHFAQLCANHKVVVRFAKEGEVDFSSPSGRLIVNILAAVAQMEAELAQERTRDMIRVKRARGERIGRAPYGQKEGEDAAAVVTAYRDTGSLHGAARLLNQQGIPTRLGRLWSWTSVRKILQVAAPDLAPRGKAPVARVGRQCLTRLLRCYCGTIMSPHSPKGKPRYWCWRSSIDPAHGYPKSVAEEGVLSWVIEEARLAVPPVDAVSQDEEHQEQRNALLENIRRNKVMYAAGDIEDEEYLEKKRTLDAEIENLEVRGRVVQLLPIDWGEDLSPREVNEYLRSLLRWVELDEQMRPVRAEWFLPELRVPAT